MVIWRHTDGQIMTNNAGDILDTEGCEGSDAPGGPCYPECCKQKSEWDELEEDEKLDRNICQDQYLPVHVDWSARFSEVHLTEQGSGIKVKIKPGFFNVSKDAYSPRYRLWVSSYDENGQPNPHITNTQGGDYIGNSISGKGAGKINSYGASSEGTRNLPAISTLVDDDGSPYPAYTPVLDSTGGSQGFRACDAITNDYDYVISRIKLYNLVDFSSAAVAKCVGGTTGKYKYKITYPKPHIDSLSFSFQLPFIIDQQSADCTNRVDSHNWMFTCVDKGYTVRKLCACLEKPRDEWDTCGPVSINEDGYSLTYQGYAAVKEGRYRQCGGACKDAPEDNWYYQWKDFPAGVRRCAEVDMTPSDWQKERGQFDQFESKRSLAMKKTHWVHAYGQYTSGSVGVRHTVKWSGFKDDTPRNVNGGTFTTTMNANIGGLSDGTGPYENNDSNTPTYFSYRTSDYDYYNKGKCYWQELLTEEMPDYASGPFNLSHANWVVTNQPRITWTATVIPGKFKGDEEETIG